MLRRIPKIEFTLIERIYNNLSLVKGSCRDPGALWGPGMPHSNLRVGKCSCGQTFECALERDMNMKLQMHSRFCSEPPRVFDEIRVPKKATTLREQQLNEYERMRKVHN